MWKTYYLCLRVYHFTLESMICLHPILPCGLLGADYSPHLLQQIAGEFMATAFLGQTLCLLNYLFSSLLYKKCFELHENVYLLRHCIPKVIFIFFLKIFQNNSDLYSLLPIKVSDYSNCGLPFILFNSLCLVILTVSVTF